MNTCKLFSLSLLLISSQLIAQEGTQNPVQSFEEAKNKFDTIALNITLTHDDVYTQDIWDNLVSIFKELQSASTRPWNDPELKKAYKAAINALDQHLDHTVHGAASVTGFIDHNIQPSALRLSLAISKKNPSDAQTWENIINLITESIDKISAVTDNTQTKAMVLNFFEVQFDRIVESAQELDARGLTPELIINIG